MHGFDVILGTDLLSSYYAKVKCYYKAVTLPLFDGITVQLFHIQELFPSYMIPTICASRLLSKGHHGLLRFH